jgi:hypothetical protein
MRVEWVRVNGVRENLILAKVVALIYYLSMIVSKTRESLKDLSRIDIGVLIGNKTQVAIAKSVPTRGAR